MDQDNSNADRVADLLVEISLQVGTQAGIQASEFIKQACSVLPKKQSICSAIMEASFAMAPLWGAAFSLSIEPDEKPSEADEQTARDTSAFMQLVNYARITSKGRNLLETLEWAQFEMTRIERGRKLSLEKLDETLDKVRAHAAGTTSSPTRN